jgi:ATP-dependent DNA helicase RecG
MADVLFKTTFLENWGTGLNRIVEACVRQNLPEPEWRMQQGFVIVIFKRPPYGAEPGTCAPSTPQVPPKYAPSTLQVERVILSMGDGYITMGEMMEACNLKDRKHFREPYFMAALSDGAIERMYPDQPNHPRQKYRLTEKALKWKKGE